LGKDKNAFLENLVIEMHDLLYNYAKLKLSDHHSAYDVVQETYLAAHKNIEKLMDSENPQGWLIEALRFKVLHEQRAKARFFILANKAVFDSSVDRSDEDKYESDIEGLLKKDEYEILHIIYIDGYSIKEAAATQEITYEACKKRVQVAKRRLAQELKE